VPAVVVEHIQPSQRTNENKTCLIQLLFTKAWSNQRRLYSDLILLYLGVEL